MTSATAAPVPVMSALPEQAAAAGDAAADGAQAKLLRALYKQHYGVVSVTCASTPVVLSSPHQLFEFQFV